MERLGGTERPEARGTERPKAPGDPRRVAVVGAGISGLAAAWRLATGPDAARVTVLESSGQVGGKLRLAEIDGLVVDVGAEAMLARRPEAVGLVREAGLSDDLVHPRPRLPGWSGTARCTRCHRAP